MLFLVLLTLFQLIGTSFHMKVYKAQMKTLAQCLLRQYVIHTHDHLKCKNQQVER
jgi:hypothetical protein